MRGPNKIPAIVHQMVPSDKLLTSSPRPSAQTNDNTVHERAK